MTDPATTPTPPAIADTRDPRDARIEHLDREARDLHRQVSELRVDVAKMRAGCIEAEHQRDVLSNELGRKASAALIASVPGHVADAMTGARHIDHAMQRALDAAVEESSRQECMRVLAVKHRRDAEAERDRAVERAVKAERERDEARADLARVNALLSPRPEPVDLVALAAQARREIGA